jgi:F0F1-type ATP synthase epsilon subunit
MELTIVSPEWTHTYHGITEVTLPAESGMTTIRPWHIHLTTTLKSWEISRYNNTIIDDLSSYADQTQRMVITGGIALLTDDSLRIMTSDI